jgi:putative oxidoreductase
MKTKTVISLVFRLVAAVIMLQTLYFKFTGQPESVYIFSAVGMEPWGRIGTGVAELVSSIFLLLPATIVLGAMMAVGIMLGAIATHLFFLGIEVQGDGGQLFFYALAVLMSSVALLWLHSERLVYYKQILLRKVL